VSAEPYYHRKQSSSQTPEVAKMQIASQEMWGGPPRNNMQSDFVKVQAFLDKLPLEKEIGIEFTTLVTPDSCTPPGMAFWTGPREGVRVEGEYAKIKVRITECNQI
jgi:hypothetical protein